MVTEAVRIAEEAWGKTAYFPFYDNDPYLLEFGKRERRSRSGLVPNSEFRSCEKPVTCRSCPLASNLMIHPDLTSYRNILLVGEGPGRIEREAMRPFTGPSGELVRSVADDTGASDWGVAYSNVLLCEGSGRLKDEDEAGFIEAMNCCSGRLFEEIEVLSPELIVAAGNIPKGILTPGERKGITSLAGEIRDAYIRGKRYSLIYILHPAYVLRDAKVFEFFWDQLLEARLFFSEVDPLTKKVILPGCQKAIDELWKGSTPITVDIETTSFSPHDMGVMYYRGKRFHRGDLLCIGLSNSDDVGYVFTKSGFERFLPQIKELLEDKGVRGQNGLFDIPWIMRWDIRPKLEDDSLLMDYAMDESPSHPLKRMSRRHLNYKDWSEALDNYLPNRGTSYANIPPKVLKRYNGLDVSITNELCGYLKGKMNSEEKRLYDELLIPTANMFLGVTHRGIKIDLGWLMHLKRIWQDRQLEILKELKGFGLRNPNSPKQVEKVFRKLGLAEEGESGTDKDVLLDVMEVCKENGDDRGLRFVGLLKEYREIQKVLWTHLFDVARSVSWLDGMVHPDPKLYATVTGRLVIASPGLLNFPHTIRLASELRKLFIPRKGYVWEHRDQKQFELRIYAGWMNDRKMIDLFNIPDPVTGKADPHHSIGFEAYGPNYPQLNEESFGVLRVIVKTIVFGRLYGRGAESVADQLNVELDEAQRICDIIDNRFETINEYRSWCEKCLVDDQVIINPFGRHRRFPVLTDENYHDCLLEGFNYPIQSTANDCNLAGMVKLWDTYDCARFDEGAPYYPMFPVHDAIDGETREDCIEEVRDQNSGILTGVPGSIFDVHGLKFVTDYSVGANWGESS